MKFFTLLVGSAIITSALGNPVLGIAETEALARRQGDRCKDTSVPCTIVNGIANCILCEYEELVNGVVTVELDWICLGIQLGILTDPCAS